MKRLLAISIASASIAIGAIPAVAEVDPKIHKLCIEAKDYAGCVRAMKGETMPTSRVINSQGADIAEGNQCPAGFAYVGGGNCMEVKCKYNPSGVGYDTGHDQRVAGKSNWGCKYSFWYGAGVMYLEGNARMSMNSACPPGEPEIGYNSTCDTAGGMNLDSNQLKNFESLDKSNPSSSKKREDKECTQYERRRGLNDCL